MLLGRIIEEAAQKSFAEVLIEELLKPLGLDTTFQAFYSVPGHKLDKAKNPFQFDYAPLWLGNRDVSQINGLSADWNGSLVSPIDEVHRFSAAVFEQEFMKPEDVEWAAQARHRYHTGIHYGSGMMRLKFHEFFPLLRGLGEPMGHLGVSGSHLFYYPEHRSHVILNFHGTNEMAKSFQAHIRIAQLTKQLS